MQKGFGIFCAVLVSLIATALLLSACGGGSEPFAVDSLARENAVTDIGASKETTASTELPSVETQEPLQDEKSSKGKTVSPNSKLKTEKPGISSTSAKSKIAPKKTSTESKAEPVVSEAKTITVTIAVDCKTAYAKDPAAVASLSKAGVILAAKQVTLPTDATVRQALDATGLRVSSNSAGAYIYGIAGLSEFDLGPGSGWVYSVNGAFPSAACTAYRLKVGDSVAWRYTCNQGEDVGSRQR